MKFLGENEGISEVSKSFTPRDIFFNSRGKNDYGKSLVQHTQQLQNSSTSQINGGAGVPGAAQSLMHFEKFLPYVLNV